jgi:hypothetical protein
MDLGAPISYLVLNPSPPTPSVLSSDGEEVGRVEHVLADTEADVVDGLVVDMRAGPGGLRFADAPQVAEIHERGVVLGIDAEQARALPEPSANPAVMDADPEDAEPEGLSDKLRRAWDLISGNY